MLGARCVALPFPLGTQPIRVLAQFKHCFSLNQVVREQQGKRPLPHQALGVPDGANLPSGRAIGAALTGAGAALTGAGTALAGAGTAALTGAGTGVTTGLAGAAPWVGLAGVPVTGLDGATAFGTAGGAAAGVLAGTCCCFGASGSALHSPNMLAQVNVSGLHSMSA